MGNKRYKRPESISRKQWLGANKNGRFNFFCLATRPPVFGIWDQVMLEPAYLATETS